MNNIKFNDSNESKEDHILNSIFNLYYKIKRIEKGRTDSNYRLVYSNCLIKEEIIGEKLDHINPDISENGLKSWNVRIDYQYYLSSKILSAYLSIAQNSIGNQFVHSMTS